MDVKISHASVVEDQDIRGICWLQVPMRIRLVTEDDHGAAVAFMSAFRNGKIRAAVCTNPEGGDELVLVAMRSFTPRESEG